MTCFALFGSRGRLADARRFGHDTSVPTHSSATEIAIPVAERVPLGGVWNPPKVCFTVKERVGNA